MNLEKVKNKILDCWDFIEKQHRENPKANLEVISILIKDDELLIDVKETKRK